MTKKLLRRTCPSGHGSGGSSPKWHAPPCSECFFDTGPEVPELGGLDVGV